MREALSRPAAPYVDWLDYLYSIACADGRICRTANKLCYTSLAYLLSFAFSSQTAFGVLFIDVRAAFHSMIREHSFGGTALPSRLCEMLSNAGLDVPQLQRDIHAHGQRFETHPSLCLQRAVRDAHAFTWYVVDGHQDCHQTHRGSRPGSPLASPLE